MIILNRLILIAKFKNEDDHFHIKKETLPQIIHEDVMIRLIAGEAYNLSSPIKTYSPMFYVDVVAGTDSTIPRPNPDQECAIYVVSGRVEAEGGIFEAGDFNTNDSFDLRFNHVMELLKKTRYNNLPNSSII